MVGSPTLPWAVYATDQPDKRFVLIIVGEHHSEHSKVSSPGTDGGLEGTAQDLLRRCEESEAGFLSLNGWFRTAIDLTLRKVTLFNDRYAMSRIFFHEGKDEFIFASEAKSLLRVRPALRAIESGALAQFLIQLRDGEPELVQGRLRTAGRLVMGFRRRCCFPKTELF